MQVGFVFGQHQLSFAGRVDLGGLVFPSGAWRSCVELPWSPDSEHGDVWAMKMALRR